MKAKQKVSDRLAFIAKQVGIVQENAELLAVPAKQQKLKLRPMTITVPQNLYELILKEELRRRIDQEKHADASSIVREALSKYFSDPASR